MANYNNDKEEDLAALAEFLSDAKGILGEVVLDDGCYLLRAFTDDHEFKSLLKQSWDEVAPRLDEVAGQIANITDEKWDKLQREGLSGVQLRLKLTAFKKLLELWRKRRTSRALGRVLGHINTLFKSLGAVFTQIDAVGEIKELLEQLLKADSRPRRPK